MRRFSIHPTRRGVTLVELMLASMIMGVVTLGAITSIYVSGRMAIDAQEDMMALEMLNRQMELVKSDGRYANLGVSEYTATETINYDPVFPNNGPIFNVDYDWYGFGTVSSSASNSITFDASDWPADTPDFTDHFILLREGNQIAQITNDTGGNGSTRTFTIDYNLNSWGTSTWGTLPPAGTAFEVDGGKWCRITMSWDRPFNQDPRTAEREVFVPWRAAGT